MIDEPHVDETQPDQAVGEGDAAPASPTELPAGPDTEDGTTEDDGEPHKAQWDLTADDLRGDARSDDDE